VLLRELQAFRESDGKLAGRAEHDDTVIALALAAFNLPSQHALPIYVGERRIL
jgi:hypothetical protein